MSRLVRWLIKSTRALLEDFFGQIVSAVIFFAAFVAWAHFSSGYAAVLVLVVGLVLWLIIGKFFDRKETKARKRT